MSEMADPKCRPQEMVRSSCYVPEEVVEEIFSWLPPKSLITFKCVCKSWYSLITSLINNPDFVAKHLHNAHNNIFSPTSLLLVDQYDSDNEYLDNSSSSENSISLLNISSGNGERDSIHFVVEELELPSPLGEDYQSEEHCGMMRGHIGGATFYHCDGIICLVYFDGIMLWNPALRESQLLPQPTIETHLDSFEADMTGFGHDPVLNDYKFLRALPDELWAIYSLNTNTWTYIMKRFGDEFRMDDPYDIMQVCHKGICYWFFSGKKNKLLSFDLHAEEFHIIPLPDCTPMWTRTLKVWTDSIAFLASSTNGGTQSIEMWVMKYRSDGVSDSAFWVKYLSIVPCVEMPLKFWKNDELLIENKDGFVTYNLRTKKLRKLINYGVDSKLRCWVSCVKSLISVNRRG